MRNMKFIFYVLALIGVLVFTTWLFIAVTKAFLIIGLIVGVWLALKIRKTFKKENENGSESN